jgi:hypothetical protein
MEQYELGEFLDNMGYDTLEDADGEYFQILKDNPDYPIIYEGSFSNDSGEPIESLLCDVDINYEDDNIIIYKEGGF